MTVDPRAVVDPGAELGEGVTVSPFAIIGPDVTIGADTWIGPHAVIQGPTTIGRENQIFQFASVGEMPQDKKYAGEPTRLEMGDRNVIRESVTINRGTVQDVGVTRIGDDNWIMAYVHIAHDCQVGNSTIFANGASLAGHVDVADHAILGGFTLIHQFCRLGEYAFTGMGSVVGKDIPPFVRVAGHPAEPRGLNNEGLSRHGFDKEDIRALREAYRTLYRQGHTTTDALDRLQGSPNQAVRRLADFVAGSERGILR
ncbi:MAG: acyl-ACP--UDP-N-acetylglucosamine O-acyltransferase [Pseudomonadota bacterium]